MTAPVDATGQLDAALTKALATGTRDAFTALLTHDVRWGGEHPGGDHECINRDQAGDHYEGLLAAGVTIQLASLQQPDTTAANTFTAQLQISSPDPDDFPPAMDVRLTLRDGLICDITILDQPPTIEVLYFDGCPHYEEFLPHLHDLLDMHGITTEVTLIRIDNDDDAQTHHFLGSPTVRIDGHDIDPDAADHHDETQDTSTSPYGMQCRLYRTPTGTTGIPSDQWILDALDHHPNETDITDNASH